MIGRKTFFIYISNLLIFCLRFAIVLLIARNLGATPLGIISFTISFIALFGFFSDLGFSSAHVKRVSEGKNIGICGGTFLLIKCVLTFSVAAMVIMVVYYLRYTGMGFTTSVELKVLGILLLWWIFTKFNEFFQFTFIAKRESVKQQLPTMVGVLIRLVIVIGIVIFSLGVVELAVSYAIAGIIILLSSFVLFKGNPINRPTIECLKSYATFAIPASLYAVIITINANIDKVMIGIFSGKEDVAYYFVGQQINFVILSLSSAVGVLVYPTISSYHTNKNFQGIRDLTHISERYLSLIITPIITLSIIFADPLIPLVFGKDFSASVRIFQILMVVSWIYTINKSYELQLPGTNRPGLGMVIVTPVVLLNIFLNIILIPKEAFGITLFGWGALGAAVGTMVASIIRFFLIRIYSYKLTKTRSNWRISLHLGAGVFMSMVIFFLMHFSPQSLYYLVGYGILGIGIYLLILVGVGEFTRKDLNFFIEIINPKKMKEYTLDELKKRGE